MAKIHGKDTAIEKKVGSYLHKRGYRFRKHVTKLPGSPDIVLPKYKAAIFIHGCFWHGHYGCRKSRFPTARRSFWEEKRRANLERDARKVTELLNAIWREIKRGNRAIRISRCTSVPILESLKGLSKKPGRCTLQPIAQYRPFV